MSQADFENRSQVLSTGSGAPHIDVPDSRGRDEGIAGSDLTAGAGGGAGFIHASLWDVIAGQGQCLTDAREYIDRMEESPELRSAALLKAMSRLRTELDRIPENASLDDPVSLTVRDAVLIARRLLTPLR